MANVQEYKKDAEQFFEEAFVDRNFSYIMEDLLSRVPEDIDKREGSIIWDALAPVALEFVVLYYELLDIYKNSFGITADRNSLILRALDRDVHLKEATRSILKADFNKEIQRGFRFNYEKLNFYVSDFIEEKEGHFYHKLVCEETGKVGNVLSGSLTPIDDIQGLEYAKIVGVITPGMDEEDTEHFRQRYFDSIKRMDYGGNIDDYKRKVLEIDGIGAVKVYPIWNGGGTVKLVIQNSEFETPSQEMINDVQTKIDPVTNHGEGIGIAPIGHTVTVVGAVDKKINLELVITTSAKASLEVVKGKVQTRVKEYLKDLAKDWQNAKTTIVRISQLESRILSVDGVLDVTDTKINGSLENLKLGEEEFPSLGVITYA